MENNSLLRHKDEEEILKTNLSLNFSTKDLSDLELKPVSRKDLELAEGAQNNNNNVTMLLVLQNVIPNITNFFLNLFTNLIEIYFLRQTKDQTIIKATTFGILYYNLLGYLPSFGMSESISVECSKSFGSKNLSLMGHQTNQVRVIIFVFNIIYTIINLLFSRSILILFAGEDKAYLEEASHYILWVIPGMFLDTQATVYVNFSESHLLYSPIYVATSVAACVNYLGCYLFISVFNLGVFGAALSYNITSLMKLLAFIVYYYIRNPYPESNFFCTKETFKLSGFKRMMFISLCTMVLVVAEFGGTFILDIFCSRLSDTSNSKNIILSSIIMIFAGFADAWMSTNTLLVGNFIGENSPNKILPCIKYSFYLSLMIMTPIYLLCIFFRELLSKFFTENENVLTSPDLDLLMILALVFHIVIFYQTFLLGIIRGSEMNLVANIVSVLVFLLFLPSLGLTLIFVFKFDVFGILLTNLISNLIAFIIWLTIYLLIDFKKICEEYYLSNNVIQEVALKEDFKEEDNRKKVQ